MRSLRAFALFAALVSVSVSQASYGLAQLAAGALTSARPTSTNPQLRQCQITFDPAITDATSVASYSLTDFKLSVKYDAQYLTVNDVLFVAPFTETQRGSIGAVPGALTPGTPSSNYIDNTSLGVINNIGGEGGIVSSKTAGQDLDIFAVDFTLKDGVSIYQPLTFTIFADPLDPTGPDFVDGTDPVTGAQNSTTAANVVPTSVTVIIGAPLPGGAAAGIVLLGVLGGWHLLNRRRATVAA